MSEDKLCPLRFLGSIHAGRQEVASAFACLGERCAMWRGYEPEWERCGPDCEGREVLTAVHREGYCGLAGRPATESQE